MAEPLFVAVDTALVGHLGAVPLAALGVAATVLQTAVGLAIFLAYATTPIVARRLGEGDRAGAVRAGIDGIWIAIGLGVALVAIGIPTAPGLAAAFGAEAAVTDAAAQYLAVGVAGLPAMLVVLAATGLFRGLQDTRTPLVIVTAGFAANAALNVALISGVGLGLLGSAIGTTVAQWGMAVAALIVAGAHTRRAGVGLLPSRSGVLASARLGWWLFLRTLSLRAVLVGTVLAAAAHGTDALAAIQVLFTVFMVAAFALDALAIAGQSMVGLELGRGDPSAARGILRRLIELSVVGGVAVGAAVAVFAWPIAAVFTGDDAVRALAAAGILVLAAGLPIGAVVWSLDGVLIGAGDGRYLAIAGLVNLAVTAPALWLAATAPLPTITAVLVIQAVFSILYMLVRLGTLGFRAHGGRWVRNAV